MKAPFRTRSSPWRAHQMALILEGAADFNRIKNMLKRHEASKARERNLLAQRSRLIQLHHTAESLIPRRSAVQLTPNEQRINLVRRQRHINARQRTVQQMERVQAEIEQLRRNRDTLAANFRRLTRRRINNNRWNSLPYVLDYLQQRRLARAIATAYFRPGGPHSRKLMANLGIV
jgi:hypothetical protein